MLIYLEPSFYLVVITVLSQPVYKKEDNDPIYQGKSSEIARVLFKNSQILDCVAKPKQFPPFHRIIELKITWNYRDTKLAEMSGTPQEWKVVFSAYCDRHNFLVNSSPCYPYFDVSMEEKIVKFKLIIQLYKVFFAS